MLSEHLLPDTIVPVSNDMLTEENTGTLVREVDVGLLVDRSLEAVLDVHVEFKVDVELDLLEVGVEVEVDVDVKVKVKVELDLLVVEDSLNVEVSSGGP